MVPWFTVQRSRNNKDPASTVISAKQTVVGRAASMRELLKQIRRSLVAATIRSAVQPGQFSPAGKALVIAPHPDDEVFGCGGLIALKRACQAPVDVLYLTSGEAAHNECCHMNLAKLGEVRRAQARTAAAALGITEDHLHWLNMLDGSVPKQNVPEFNIAVDGVAGILRKTGPDELYCPHPLDCWPDHEAANRIVLAALKKSGRPVAVRFYLVWSWYNMPLRRLFRPGLGKAYSIDISAVLDAKKAAVNTYIAAHPPGCPNPYVGALPKGFLEPFRKPNEIFFQSEELE